MAEVAIDFGTSNTVVARHDGAGQVQTIALPELSFERRYRSEAVERIVHLVPSLIHYTANEMLIGQQVIARGLATHPETIRWMKRGIAQGVSRRRKTAQGFKSPTEAGADFLRTLLHAAADQLDFTQNRCTFTVPVEAFENFQDWLLQLAATLGMRNLRTMDEPTACILGGHGLAHRDERFLIFDFGGGTLDVSAVRLDLNERPGRTAGQLGQAGCDLGGMDLDRWMADEFCTRLAISAETRHTVEAELLQQAEATKIALSLAENDTAEMEVQTTPNEAHTERLVWRRNCRHCDGQQAEPTAHEACFGCLLARHHFSAQVRETVTRALENAAVQSGLRRADLTRVLATGGSTLIPAVRRLLREAFGDKLVFDHPFDAVVRGATQGTVVPLLQHDYAIESYNRAQQRFEFKTLFKAGTEYPTTTARFWANGVSDGMTRVGLRIYEVSRRHRLNDASEERFSPAAPVSTTYEHLCLNPDNPTFIPADPPVRRERDQQRFLCSFEIDGHRRLFVSAVDQLTGKPVLVKHPVVRLDCDERV